MESLGCSTGVLPPVLSQADWQPSLQSIQLSQRHWLSRKTETIPGKEGQTTATGPQTLAGGNNHSWDRRPDRNWARLQCCHSCFRDYRAIKVLKITENMQNHPILDTRISVLRPSFRVSRSGDPHWILKRGQDFSGFFDHF